MQLKATPEFDNCWAFQDEQLRLLITEMHREMSTGWALGSLYGDSLSTAFVIALIRKYGRTARPFPQLKGGLSPARLRLVRSYIDENLNRDIRLYELASISGLSEYHFARSFRQTTGVTPHQYLTQIRIGRAKSLLLRPQWTILPGGGRGRFLRFQSIFKGLSSQHRN
jgi:AraC family transcriptional regulator